MATEVLTPQKCVLNSFRFRNRGPCRNPYPRAAKQKKKDQKKEGISPKPKKEASPKPHEPSRNSVPIQTVMISKSGEDLDRHEEKKAMKERKLMSQLRKAAKRVVFAGHVAPLPPSRRKLPQPGFIRGGASKVSPLNI